MLYSFRIEQAIRAASLLHEGQVRRGRVPYPVISHLFAVSCIVADYTKDEDTIVASILHDALDATGYTLAELESDFGSKARSIVEEVSLLLPPGDTRSWREQKQEYLQRLRKVSPEALTVVAADTIHNMRSVIEEYRAHHADYLRDFGGTLEDRVFFYGTLRNLLNKRLESTIVNELNHVIAEFVAFSGQKHV